MILHIRLIATEIP
jgi:hypothetical protein